MFLHCYRVEDHFRSTYNTKVYSETGNVDISCRRRRRAILHPRVRRRTTAKLKRQVTG